MLLVSKDGVEDIGDVFTLQLGEPMTYNGNSKRPSITWDRTKLNQFRLAYGKAADTKGDKDVFQFEGHEFVLGYAKYLIQFLDGKLQRAA